MSILDIETVFEDEINVGSSMGYRTYPGQRSIEYDGKFVILSAVGLYYGDVLPLTENYLSQTYTVLTMDDTYVYAINYDSTSIKVLRTLITDWFTTYTLFDLPTGIIAGYNASVVAAFIAQDELYGVLVFEGSTTFPNYAFIRLYKIDVGSLILTQIDQYDTVEQYGILATPLIGLRDEDIKIMVFTSSYFDDTTNYLFHCTSTAITLEYSGLPRSVERGTDPDTVGAFSTSYFRIIYSADSVDGFYALTYDNELTIIKKGYNAICGSTAKEEPSLIGFMKTLNLTTGGNGLYTDFNVFKIDASNTPGIIHWTMTKQQSMPTMLDTFFLVSKYSTFAYPTVARLTTLDNKNVRLVYTNDYQGTPTVAITGNYPESEWNSNNIYRFYHLTLPDEITSIQTSCFVCTGLVRGVKRVPINTSKPLVSMSLQSVVIDDLVESISYENTFVKMSTLYVQTMAKGDSMFPQYVKETTATMDLVVRNTKMAEVIKQLDAASTMMFAITASGNFIASDDFDTGVLLGKLPDDSYNATLSNFDTEYVVVRQIILKGGNNLSYTLEDPTKIGGRKFWDVFPLIKNIDDLMDMAQEILTSREHNINTATISFRLDSIVPSQTTELPIAGQIITLNFPRYSIENETYFVLSVKYASGNIIMNVADGIHSKLTEADSSQESVKNSEVLIQNISSGTAEVQSQVVSNTNYESGEVKIDWVYVHAPKIVKSNCSYFEYVDAYGRNDILRFGTGSSSTQAHVFIGFGDSLTSGYVSGWIIAPNLGSLTNVSAIRLCHNVEGDNTLVELIFDPSTLTVTADGVSFAYDATQPHHVAMIFEQGELCHIYFDGKFKMSVAAGPFPVIGMRLTSSWVDTLFDAFYYGKNIIYAFANLGAGTGIADLYSSHQIVTEYCDSIRSTAIDLKVISPGNYMDYMNVTFAITPVGGPASYDIEQITINDGHVNCWQLRCEGDSSRVRQDIYANHGLEANSGAFGMWAKQTGDDGRLEITTKSDTTNTQIIQWDTGAGVLRGDKIYYFIAGAQCANWNYIVVKWAINGSTTDIDIYVNNMYYYSKTLPGTGVTAFLYSSDLVVGTGIVYAWSDGINFNEAELSEALTGLGDGTAIINGAFVSDLITGSLDADMMFGHVTSKVPLTEDLGTTETFNFTGAVQDITNRLPAVPSNTIYLHGFLKRTGTNPYVNFWQKRADNTQLPVAEILTTTTTIPFVIDMRKQLYVTMFAGTSIIEFKYTYVDVAGGTALSEYRGSSV